MLDPDLIRARERLEASGVQIRSFMDKAAA